MILHGKNIMVYANVFGDWRIIAGAKSCNVKSSAEIIETASPINGEWFTGIAGRKKWSLGFNYLVHDVSAFGYSDSGGLYDLLQVGNTYQIRISEGSVEVSGSAILESVDIVATNGNLCTGSFQFRGITPMTYS